MDPATFRSMASADIDTTVTPSFASSMKHSVPLNSQMSVTDSVQLKSQSVASSLLESVSIKISGDEDSNGKKQSGILTFEHLIKVSS